MNHPPRRGIFWPSPPNAPRSRLPRPSLIRYIDRQAMNLLALAVFNLANHAIRERGSPPRILNCWKGVFRFPRRSESGRWQTSISGSDKRFDTAGHELPCVPQARPTPRCSGSIARPRTSPFKAKRAAGGQVAEREFGAYFAALPSDPPSTSEKFVMVISPCGNSATMFRRPPIASM